MPLPEFVAARPELAPGLEFFYASFWELSTCRSLGWVVGPIPWTAVCEWSRRHGLDDEQAADLEHVIRAMDAVFLGHLRSSTKPKGSQT